jgi:hypothetical protein
MLHIQTDMTIDDATAALLPKYLLARAYTSSTVSVVDIIEVNLKDVLFSPNIPVKKISSQLGNGICPLGC